MDTIRVVIPVYRDTESLGSLLHRLREVEQVDEIVVVEGSEDRRSLEIARDSGADWIDSLPGRGLQMHRGAMAGAARILWFLHADSVLPDGAVAAMRAALSDPSVAGGAFAFRLAERRWYGAWLERTVNWRTRVARLPYGDQGYFMRREIYDEIGGFAPLPIMEDVELMSRLRLRRHLVWLDHAIGVSPRRWDREGFFRTTSRNLLLFAAFKLGVSAERLRAWYPP